MSAKREPGMPCHGNGKRGTSPRLLRLCTGGHTRSVRKFVLLIN